MNRSNNVVVVMQCCCDATTTCPIVRYEHLCLGISSLLDFFSSKDLKPKKMTQTKYIQKPNKQPFSPLSQLEEEGILNVDQHTNAISNWYSGWIQYHRLLSLKVSHFLQHAVVMTTAMQPMQVIILKTWPTYHSYLQLGLPIQLF